MAKLKVKVRAELGDRAVEKSAEYPADDFEQANRAIGFAAEELLGQAILEVLDKAGVHPKPQPGGEDHDVR